MTKRIMPCIKCGSKDIQIWDCGYSSFNVGGAKCKNCENEVKLDPCDCYPKNDIIRAWNKSNPTLAKKVKEYETEIEENNRQIKEHKVEIRKLKKRINES